MSRAELRRGYGGPVANYVAFDCATLTGVSASVGTGGAVEFDSGRPSPRSAAGSIKMIQPTISSSFVQFTKDVSPAVSANALRGVGVWLYISDADGSIPSTVTFGVYFGATPGDTSGGFATFIASISGARNDGWYFVAGERASASYGGGASAASWATGSVTRVVCQRYGVASEVPFWVGGVELCYPARPKLILSFDGQYESIRDYVKPLMDARGLVGTMFVSWDVVGAAGRMSLADIESLPADGWDIGPRKFDLNSIGYDNQISYPTAESIADDIRNAQLACLAAGGSVACSKIQCIPTSNPWSGGNSYAIRRQCSDGFNMAGVRVARNGSEVSSGIGNGVFTNQIHETGNVGHLAFLFARQLHNAVTSSTALSDVDQAIKLGSTMVHYMHKTAAAGSNGYWPEASALEYLNGIALRQRQGLIDVVNFGEWLDGLNVARRAA